MGFSAAQAAMASAMASRWSPRASAVPPGRRAWPRIARVRADFLEAGGQRGEPVALLGAQARAVSNAPMPRRGRVHHRHDGRKVRRFGSVQIRERSHQRGDLPVGLKGVLPQPGHAHAAAQRVGGQKERGAGPIALRRVGWRRGERLPAGHPVARAHLLHGDAEIRQHSAREIHIARRFQRRGEADFAPARQRGQGQQQPGDELAGNVARQFKDAARELAAQLEG